MSMNIKKQAAVGLILASIGGLCPLQAMQRSHQQAFGDDLARAIANNLLEINNIQQVMEIGQDGDSDLEKPIALNLTNNSNSFEHVSSFNGMPPEIKDLILFVPFFDESANNEGLGELSLVCQDWRNFIKEKFKLKEDVWKTYYGFTDSEYQLIKNTKVQYRPDPKSNEGMITLKIPTFANPFGHIFNLSRCGDASKYLCISMGYRTAMKLENKDKVEIFVASRKVIEKNLATSAAHYEPIMTKWSNAHPVGVFYTWGNWENNNWYDYVTNHSPDDIATKNLQKLAYTSAQLRPISYTHHPFTSVVRFAKISLLF